MNLSPSEIRVLGCLLEKQRTTPDAYPLSLNALRLACNQSTNREPVVQYDEAVIRDALHRLERRGYTRLASGGRAAKHRHLLAEALPMSEDEQAVMCVLMLRGPQTPGELKQRTERMHSFADLGGVHETLERLIGRELVAVLERRPGQKEERYVELLGEGAEVSDAVAPSPMSMPTPVPRAVDGLEERVARLEREVARLRAALGDVPGQAQSSDRGPGEEQSSDRGPGEEQSSDTGPGEEQSSFPPPNQEAEHTEAELAASADGEEEAAAAGGETLEWT
jgi:uncharacterized protein YceH (UPF0502 family)